MSDGFEAYGVDRALAAKAHVQQIPTQTLLITGIERCPVSKIVMPRFYRFGNNVYQAFHALMIARRLKIGTVMACGFDLLEPCPGEGDVEVALEVVQDYAVTENALLGSFFLPFGFETLFQGYGIAETHRLVARYGPKLYASLVEPARQSTIRTVALHFRSGDVFVGDGHPLYTQPPVAFYLRALEHALQQRSYDLIDLVYEDRANPAIEAVEQALRHHGVVFRSGSGSVAADVTRLLSAQCVIASCGTFCEGAALLSPKLEAFYAFRGFSSQGRNVPFLQSRIQALVEAAGVSVTMVDDIGSSYTGPWSWTNSPAQHAAILEFPAEKLRLYDGSLPHP